MIKASYLNLTQNKLKEKVDKAITMLAECHVCAQNCRVNRLEGETGFCGGGRLATVSSYCPHFGEEDVLVGYGGSGTIFFAYCNLACEFCQNYEISCEGRGVEVSAKKLAGFMLNLQVEGCHNINLVSPSHFVPQILEALLLAKEHGLKIPLVYNTGGYDSLETLNLLNGIVDIYMPDLKFGNDENGKKYSKATDYFTIAKAAVRIMYDQVGDLVVDEQGIAVKGLLVRHLVLPNNLAGTEKVMEFISKEVSSNTFVNVMQQYRPAHRAFHYSELNRRPTSAEFNNALRIAKSAGLKRIYT